MAGSPELLDRLFRNEITLRDYERMCGLDPKETDEDLMFDCMRDAIAEMGEM